MGMPDQLDSLLLITGECLTLIEAGHVEEYLSLEHERRHLMDTLSTQDPADRGRLEQLQALTAALTDSVSQKTDQVKRELADMAPSDMASSYSSWA